jgi:hypothetical protein
MYPRIDRKRREDLVAYIRDLADKSILKDFPKSFHPYILAMMEKIVDNTESRIVIHQGRQMGKTTLNQMFIETFVNGLDKPIYIKKFYLRSGTFEFRLYNDPKRWELVKITKPNKWEATSIDYILKFLVRRGADPKDIVEIEQKVFERIS